MLPAVLAGGLAVGQTGLAEETADILKELRQQIEQLDQKVKVLERKRELDDDAFPLLANPAAFATEATSSGVGLNWHLNKNVKLNLNYEQTGFKGATAPCWRRAKRLS